MLRPHETIQKLLLSTPSRFVAAYERDDVVVTHAWDFERPPHDERSPLHRTFFMLTFSTPELQKRPGSMVPNYSPTGDYICAMLAVLFGKRFDHHGAVEMTGLFHVPNLERASDLCDPKRPYHGSHLRADHPVSLDLREVARFSPLIHDEPADVELMSAFNTAALFYARALRTVGRDPEVAYLHLITACERIADIADLQAVELEGEVKTALARIEAEMEGGDRIARLLRSRMRQLKRRFTAVITSHFDRAFFTRTESTDEWGALKAEDFPRAASAAYDLRSRFVHTGASFGSWIEPRSDNAERQHGAPVLPDKQMARILARAPTFIGLERVTRMVLLACAKRLGAHIPDASPAEDITEPGPLPI